MFSFLPPAVSSTSVLVPAVESIEDNSAVFLSSSDLALPAASVSVYEMPAPVAPLGIFEVFTHTE